MSEHINGIHRDQTVLFPDKLDDYVDRENPVRFIDAFIDSLNLEKLRSSNTPSQTRKEDRPTTHQICSNCTSTAT